MCIVVCNMYILGQTFCFSPPPQVVVIRILHHLYQMVCNNLLPKNYCELWNTQTSNILLCYNMYYRRKKRRFLTWLFPPSSMLSKDKSTHFDKIWITIIIFWRKFCLFEFLTNITCNCGFHHIYVVYKSPSHLFHFNSRICPQVALHSICLIRGLPNM